MRAKWVAVSIVATGSAAKNRWVCRACDKNCSAVLPLSEAPSNNCNGGYDDKRAKSNT